MHRILRIVLGAAFALLPAGFAAAAPDDIDPCAFLSKDDAAALIGTPLGGDPVRANAICQYSSATDPKLRLFVSVLSLGPPTKMIYQSKAGEPGTTAVSGIGDAAFVSSEERADPKEYYFTVLQGEVMLQITTSGIHQDDPKAAMIKAGHAALPHLLDVAKG